MLILTGKSVNAIPEIMKQVFSQIVPVCPHRKWKPLF